MTMVPFEPKGNSELQRVDSVCIKSHQSARLGSPCARHDFWTIEGKGVALIGLRPHLVGFNQDCVCEELVGLEVEL